MNDTRRFSYFLFENFDAAAAAGNPMAPRSILNPSADGVLAWMADTPPLSRTRTAACDLFSEETVDRLMHAGALREEQGTLFYDTPIFLSGDAEPLAAFCRDAAAGLADRVSTVGTELFRLTDALKNDFSPEINLYHIVCGMCFDGLFLEKLSELGVLANSRMHDSGLDYLSVIYEKCPELDGFSGKLLCSWNRIADETCALQSFGDADGDRLDCYRYFRLRQRGDLPAAFAEVHRYARELSESDLLNAVRSAAQGMPADPKAIGALEAFGYLKKGRPCVPVFGKQQLETILKIETLLEDALLEPVRKLLSDLHRLDITAVRHGVAAEEIANECWHVLFGRINGLLADRGLVAQPPFRSGEGRYLRSIELDI